VDPGSGAEPVDVFFRYAASAANLLCNGVEKRSLMTAPHFWEMAIEDVSPSTTPIL